MILLISIFLKLLKLNFFFKGYSFGLKKFKKEVYQKFW